jgi:zinc protease
MTTVATVRPLPGARRPYRFPAFERLRLPNGVELLIAPVRRLPLVSIRFVMDVGARHESREQAGVASLTGRVLAEGTTRLDAVALADEFERLGGSLLSYATWDSTNVRTTVLSSRLEPALRLLTEVVRAPAFPEREVNRLIEERLADLMELESEPRGLADVRFSDSLYKPTSRFSLQEGGSERTVASLARTSCVDWHVNHFAPSATALVVAGDVDVDEVVRLAGTLLEDWTPPAHVDAGDDDTAANLEQSVRLLDRPGAPQSELRLGHVGLRRDHPDYFDVTVMNAILGGVFNSRINLNLRERHAFTYGAFSSFEWRRDAGPFVVSTAVATTVTAPAIREVLTELEQMQQGPPLPDELTLSTSYLEGVFPIRFETTDAIAGALGGLVTLRLPDDFYDTYRDRILAVSAEHVLRAAREHIHLNRLQVFVVGDRAQVLPALDAFSPGAVSLVGGDEK